MMPIWCTEFLSWLGRRCAHCAEFATTSLALDHGPLCTTRPAALVGRGYRLQAWPELPASLQTAEIYRVLSFMSTQPINAQWLRSESHLSAQEALGLLHYLQSVQALQAIDLPPPSSPSEAHRGA